MNIDPEVLAAIVTACVGAGAAAVRGIQHAASKYKSKPDSERPKPQQVTLPDLATQLDESKAARKLAMVDDEGTPLAWCALSRRAGARAFERMADGIEETNRRLARIEEHIKRDAQ